ncbi:MAG: efflux RND transporter periplasmic adaptor subunit [Methylobacteriaceae bacterium]|nr:efflux RND transporter periplasmic adaptor subunit [Methylobacteriaceae bacterium]
MRVLRWIVFLLVLAALAGGLWWRQIGRGPLVAVAPPTRGVVAEVVYATGVVEPERWAKVVPLNRKRVVDLCFCESQTVAKGDVLARLDDGEERAQLAELQATRDKRSRDVERATSLAARAAGTQTSVDQAQTALAEIEARILAQKDRIDELVLRAPMDGVVLRRDGQIGEIVGQTDVLFWVGQPKPLRIVADVNEEDILKVRPGQKALLRNDAVADRRVAANVGEITPKGDPQTKTFRVYLPLPDDTPLRIGMSVEANIVVREKEDALLVPADALIGEALFIFDGERLSRRAVKTGVRGARNVEIVDGLAENDRVAAPARADWRDGMRARLAAP